MKKIPQSQIVIYQATNGETKIDVRFDGDTVWLTLEQMAQLFDKARSTINEHILNIYKEGELVEALTIQKIGNSDFLEKPTHYYNLDVIISVGYRVKSIQGTRFRQWATERLSEYIVKGFVIDSERLKNPDLPFDYFEELERTIADIRTSEKRFYRKITDIYATSVDYDPTNDQSLLFFKTVQNKVHYAITGSTAAEIVAERIDEKKKNLGLTYTRGSKPTKEEVSIAKNYYNKEELTQLNALVEQYLVFATEQARRRVPMKTQNRGQYLAPRKRKNSAHSPAQSETRKMPADWQAGATGRRVRLERFICKMRKVYSGCDCYRGGRTNSCFDFVIFKPPCPTKPQHLPPTRKLHPASR